VLSSRPQRRRLSEDTVIPLAPLIDVVFLLLVFFMLITRFLNPSIDLTLPGSTTAQLNDSHSVTIIIDSAGTLWMDDEPLPWNELTTRLGAVADKTTTVRLRADGTTPHRDVVRAFDCIRSAGLDNIALEAIRESGN
jgi:biopolymer transport protein ExbD